MPTERIIDRVRKLLELANSANEHEAALAASKAAELMSQHEINEAMLRVTGEDDADNAHVAERIVEGNLPDATERRVAWRDRVASAMARSLDCETYYWANNLHAMGRESNVATWKYTCGYLFNEIERLADKAWLEDGADLAAVGQRPRVWKGAFRLGAADTVANKLYADLRDRTANEKESMLAAASKVLSTGAVSRADMALVFLPKAIAVVTKDRAEVKAAFAEKTKGWKNTAPLGQSTRNRSGYQAGREAGATISIHAARGALKS